MGVKERGRGRGKGAYGKPDCAVRVSGDACAAGVLFVAEGFDDDGVVEGSWFVGGLR